MLSYRYSRVHEQEIRIEFLLKPTSMPVFPFFPYIHPSASVSTVSRQAEVARADGEHVSGIVGNNRRAGSKQGGEISSFLGIAGPERA